MSDVVAHEVQSFDDMKNPGDFMFTTINGWDGPAGLIEICPCGCGATGAIAFDIPVPGRSGPKWKWNGSRDKPTLTPSILRTSGCRWHGYLTDGVFRSC